MNCKVFAIKMEKKELGFGNPVGTNSFERIGSSHESPRIASWIKIIICTHHEEKELMKKKRMNKVLHCSSCCKKMN